MRNEFHETAHGVRGEGVAWVWKWKQSRRELARLSWCVSISQELPGGRRYVVRHLVLRVYAYVGCENGRVTMAIYLLFGCTQPAHRALRRWQVRCRHAGVIKLVVLVWWAGTLPARLTTATQCRRLAACIFMNQLVAARPPADEYLIDAAVTSGWSWWAVLIMLITARLISCPERAQCCILSQSWWTEVSCYSDEHGHNTHQSIISDL